MSILDKEGWYKIDNNSEEKVKNGVRFVRPIVHDTVSIDCISCKKLIATVEDVEYSKISGSCESCHQLYYIPNKEKWENGWRPNI